MSAAYLGRRGARAPLDAKRWSTYVARAALMGIALSRIEDDHGREVYVVTRWALTRQLDDLAELETFLDRGARLSLVRTKREDMR